MDANLAQPAHYVPVELAELGFAVEVNPVDKGLWLVRYEHLQVDVVTNEEGDLPRLHDFEHGHLVLWRYRVTPSDLSVSPQDNLGTLLDALDS